MSTFWKVGDWVVFDLKIGQIKEIRDGGMADFSDGLFCTSGRILERFRPLTLQNKNIVETLHTIYKRLNHLDGEAGFNYPDIYTYFSQIALDAIDSGDFPKAFDLAGEFVNDARDYKPIIQGVRLFRRNLRNVG